jgi:hypothetical protein
MPRAYRSGILSFSATNGSFPTLEPYHVPVLQTPNINPYLISKATAKQTGAQESDSGASRPRRPHGQPCRTGHSNGPEGLKDRTKTNEHLVHTE